MTDAAQAAVDAPAWTGAPLTPYEVGDPGRAAREVVASLPVNAGDPADTQLDGGAIGSLVVRAASSCGVSHRHGRKPRQDDYALCTADDRWLVIAVADGVSAGPLSHLAATIACRSAATVVRDALVESGELAGLSWEDVVGQAAKRIVVHGRRTLGAKDGPDEVSPEHVAEAMATTLVVVALPVEPDADGGTRVGVALALGDTSVFRLSSGAWTPVTRVKNEGAEIATSATVALPYMPTEPLEPVEVRLEPGEALFVMTDGVGDPLGRGDGVVGSFLAEAWEAPPDLLTFGGQVGFARRSFDDDRTVVGVWAGG